MVVIGYCVICLGCVFVGDVLYDVIIVDIWLFDMFGYEILMKFKELMSFFLLILMIGFGYDLGYLIVKVW